MKQKAYRAITQLWLLLLLISTTGLYCSIFNQVIFSAQEQFFMACHMLDVEEIEQCLQKGADIHACTSEGDTALAFAVQNPFHIKEVSFLLEKGVAIDKPDNYGVTPLMVAAQFHNSEIIELLLKHGANNSLKDKYGRTTLQRAFNHIFGRTLVRKYDTGHLIKSERKSLRLLLEHTSDSEILCSTFFRCMKEIQVCREERHKDQETELIICARMIFTHCMRVGCSQENLCAMLGWVCFCNLPKFVEPLFKAGANPNEGNGGEDPLFLRACKYSGKEVLQLFLDAEVDINCRNQSGNGALHMAARGSYGNNGNKEAVEFLLSKSRRQKELPLLAGLFE